MRADGSRMDSATAQVNGPECLWRYLSAVQPIDGGARPRVVGIGVDLDPAATSVTVTSSISNVPWTAHLARGGRDARARVAAVVTLAAVACVAVLVDVPGANRISGMGIRSQQVISPSAEA